MDLAEIKRRIDVALKTRPPRWGGDDHYDLKVDTLADYLLKCAHQRADLEEARAWLGEAFQRFEVQWDAIEPEGTFRTVSARDSARRAVAPDVAAGRDAAKHHLATIDRLVRRFEMDEKCSSRIYTLLTGNA